MFEWDDGNLDHIAEHGVDDWEAEEAIQDRRRIPFSAVYGGRRGIVGRTSDGRLLVVIFEQAGGVVRVVTAYDASARGASVPKGATMRPKDLIPLTSIDQVPRDMTDDEAHEFWSTHEVTEEYLASAPSVPEEDLPPIRPPQKWVSLHLRRGAFEKVRKLARQRGVLVTDLIDALATEALAAEQNERVRVTGT